MPDGRAGLPRPSRPTAAGGAADGDTEALVLYISQEARRRLDERKEAERERERRAAEDLKAAGKAAGAAEAPPDFREMALAETIDRITRRLKAIEEVMRSALITGDKRMAAHLAKEAAQLGKELASAIRRYKGGRRPAAPSAPSAPQAPGEESAEGAEQGGGAEGAGRPGPEAAGGAENLDTAAAEGAEGAGEAAAEAGTAAESEARAAAAKAEGAGGGAEAEEGGDQSGEDGRGGKSGAVGKSGKKDKSDEEDKENKDGEDERRAAAAAVSAHRKGLEAKIRELLSGPKAKQDGLRAAVEEIKQLLKTIARMAEAVMKRRSGLLGVRPGDDASERDARKAELDIGDALEGIEEALRALDAAMEA